MSVRALFRSAIAWFHFAVSWSQLWNAAPFHTAGNGSIAEMNALAWLLSAETEVSRFDECWFTALSVIENFVPTEFLLTSGDSRDSIQTNSRNLSPPRSGERVWRFLEQDLRRAVARCGAAAGRGVSSR